MGGELRWDQYNQFGNLFLRGQFRFEPNATTQLSPTGAAVAGTGNAFAEYLLGYGKRNQGSVVPAEIKFRATSQAYYIDDTWKIHPKVSLNLGLRYEYTPPFLDKTGNLVNFHVPFVDMTPNVADMSRHPTVVRQGRGDFYDGLPIRFEPSVKVARDGRLGDRLVADDKNDFAPRLGIAWNPNSKWVVRTGAGLFYAQDTGNPRFDIARNVADRPLHPEAGPSIDFDQDTPFQRMGDAKAPSDKSYGLDHIHS